MSVRRLEVLLTGRDRGAGRAIRNLGDAGDDVARRLGRAGDRAGDGFVRGVDGRLRDLRGRFIQEGQQAGEGFGDAASAGADDTGTGGLSGWLGGLGGVLGGAAMAGGLAVGAIFAVGFVEAIERGAQEDKFAAQLGGSPEFQAEMGGIAGDLYANAYGESLADAQQALRGVWQNGLVSEDASSAEIEDVTAKVLDLSTAFDQDLGMSTQAVGAMLRNGLAPDAEAALDIITRGMQQGADQAGDLLETYQEYSSLFRDLGLDGATATGLLSQGLQAGARDADFVADALKEFAIRGQDASDTSAQAFEMIGLNAEEMTAKVAAGGPEATAALDEVLDGLRGMEDPVARNAAAVGLFGTKAEDLGDALFALDPSEAAARLGEVGGAAEEMGETLNDNASTKIEAFKRKALGGLTSFIGDNVIPGFEGFLDRAGPIFDDLLAAWDADGLDGVAAKLGDLWEVGWPIVQAKGREFLGRVGSWLQAEGPGIARRLGEGLYAAGDWIVQNYPVFAQKMGAFWARVGTWIAEVGVPWLGQKARELGPALWQWVQDAYPAFAQRAAVLWTQLGGWILGTAVPQLLVWGGRLWSAMFEWLWTDAVPALWRGLWSVRDSLAVWFDNNAVPWLRTKAGELWDLLRAKAVEGGTAAVEWLKTLPGMASAWFDGTARPWLQAKAAELWDALREKAEEKGNEALDWLRGLPGRVVDAVGDLTSTLYSAGRDVIQGLIDGIEDKVRDLPGILGDVGGLIVEHKGPPEHDRVMLRPAGQLIMGGLVDGLHDGEAELWDRLGMITRRLEFDDVDLARPPVTRGTFTHATDDPATVRSGGGGAADTVPLTVDRIVLEAPDGRVLAEAVDVRVLARRVDLDRRSRAGAR